MKRIVIGTLFSLTLACSTLLGTPPAASSRQATIESMASLTESIGMPQHLTREDATRTAEDFDVMNYFSVLKHLSLEPGFVLDYVYYFDGMGGHPVLYVRPGDQPAFETYAAYMRGVDGDTAGHAYLDSIHVDDTPEGFFELVTLDVMGSQFYLFWHAGYNDRRILCTRDAADQVIKASDRSGAPMDNKTQTKALKLDFEPQVTMGDETVEVQVVTFSLWGGFRQEIYTIHRAFPHTILDISHKDLVPFDCGIRF